MIELLKLCGYEANEIETELPRVKKVFDRLGITVEDIERGRRRLAKYFDMKLVGVRKVFGLCMKDVINTVLAREEGKKKILYGFMSPGFEILGSALATRSTEVYAAMLPMSFHFVLGQIFSKTVPILEAAEHSWVKAGKVSHCGNVKTLVGLLALDMIPKPDLLVTSGYLCDTAPKTVDIIQELYNIPTYCYTTCQDREFKQYPDAERIIKLSARSMRHLAAKMQEIAGVEMTDDMIWESYNSRDELRKALVNLQNLMETSDPLPISTTHEIFWAHLGALPVIIPEVGELASVLDTLYRELQTKVDTGEGVTEKGAPRIFSLPTHYTDPRWEHAICEIGIAPVASETGCFPARGSKKNVDGMARYGIVSPKVFGVSVAEIRTLAKGVGRDHDLATSLWKSGWYEARMLTSFIDEPERVTPSQMDRWAKDFDNWAICDTLCFHLFDRTPHAWKQIAAWSTQREEFVKRAAFALLASVAVHDKKAPDKPFLKSLRLIERAATDDRNFVKKGVSWALRGIGHRNLALHTAAVKTARTLAASTDPSARWIGKDALRDLLRPAARQRVAGR